MAERRTDFFIQTSIVDSIIQNAPSDDPIATKVILKRIKESNDLLKYFFSQRPSSDWASDLLENGIFENPTPVEVVENGFKTPFWPQSNYLRDIAHEKPEIVFSVIRNISTNNPTIHSDLIEALAKIKTPIPIPIISIIKTWLENKYLTNWSKIPENLVRLIINLFINKQNDIALELLDELICPNQQDRKKNNNQITRYLSKSRFDLTYCQPDFWKISLPQIETYDREKVFLSILTNFRLTLDSEYLFENTNESYYLSRTSSWRSSIWDTHQDNDESYKSFLLRATRDSLCRIISTDKVLGQTIITNLLEQKTPIYLRIVIYAVALFASDYVDLIKKFLLDEEIMFMTEYHNDYFELLKNSFSQLPNESQQIIISSIHKGPPAELVNELATNAFKYYGDDIQEYSIRYSENWIKDRLWVIRQQLNNDELALLDYYVQKYGEPQHPEFLSYISEVFTVIEESPLSENEIIALKPEQLVEYIKKWVPDSKYHGRSEISHRGFAEMFAKVFFENPHQYSSVINQFSDMPSFYISEIFSVAQNRLKEAQPIPWEELFILLNVIAETSKSIKSSETNQACINERLQALWFIDTVLHMTDDLSETRLLSLEKVLIVFSKDFDPDDKRDNPPENFMGFNDPLTVALNSIRPLAINSLIELIRKDRNISKKNQQKGVINYKDIFHILTNKLEKGNDPSWAVHSVFGKHSPFLYLIDPIWYKNKLPIIFPENPDDEKFFLAAWDSYLLYNRPFLELVSLLRQKYIYAIDLLSSGKKLTSTNVGENHLANHLILDYFSNPYSLTTASDNNLLSLFFTKCDLEISSGAVWVLWRINEQMSEEGRINNWESTKDIWKWRTNELILSAYSNEYFSEIQWFSYLLLCIPNHENINTLNSFIEPMLVFIDHYVIWQNLEKFLSNQVEKYPDHVIKFYKLMHERLKNPEFGPYNYDEESDNILIQTVKNPKCKADALWIMNFTARFTPRYRKLYEENT